MDTIVSQLVDQHPFAIIHLQIIGRQQIRQCQHSVLIGRLGSMSKAISNITGRAAHRKKNNQQCQHCTGNRDPQPVICPLIHNTSRPQMLARKMP